MQASELVGVRARGVGAAVVVAMLVAMLLVAAEPAAASHYTNTTELSGSTNTAVAAAWSKATFPTTSVEVLLGRDDVFADSLASGGMQGTRPLLLTASQALSADAEAELTRLNPTWVNILGGTSAVSTAVEDDLKAQGYQVRRFSGPTRIETAIDVARRAVPAATSAILAAAFSPDEQDQTRAFADSISAGGWAADRNMPVLLTENSRLSIATRNYLREAPIRTVYVVGGSSAVSDAAVTELRQIGKTVERVSGPTRFDTAIAIARERGFSDASKATEVVLTEGQAADAWVAGFTAAAYSASTDAPIVLSNGANLPAPTTTWLSPTAKAAATQLVCAPRVTAGACDTASEAMGHTPITGTTPRLLAASVDATAAGVTKVRYTFSEPVAPQVSAGSFKVYAYDTLATQATAAARDSARQDVVVAEFPATAIEGATVAAVAFEAVRGITTNVRNSEGSVGLQAFTPAAGDSRGPNLIGLTPVNTPANSASWTVVFTFDKPISACGSGSSFKLVATEVPSRSDAQQIAVYSGSGGATLEGTSACEVRFSSMPGTANDSFTYSTDVARGFAEAGAATAGAGGYPSPPGAVGVARFSDAPDLVSVSRVAGSTTQIIFTFDNDDQIDSAVNVNQASERFKVYDSRGNVYTGDSATPDATQSPNITRVTVTFNASELRNVILGGSVDAGAVKGRTRTGTGLEETSLGRFNGPDEAGMSAGPYAAGETAAPRLTGITRTTSGSGATASVTLRFSYSGTVDRGTGGYFVYTDAGERVAITGCAAATTDGGDDVDCTIASSSTAQYNAARAAAIAGAAYDAVRADGQNGAPIDESAASPEHGGTLA